LYPYDIYYNLGISNEVSTKGTKDVQCFTNKQVKNTCVFYKKMGISSVVCMDIIIDLLEILVPSKDEYSDGNCNGEYLRF